MADDIITSGPMSDDLGTLINVQSPKPPFNKSSYIYTRELIVNTDYTSGNDIVFKIPAAVTVEWASFTTHDGTVVTYTEAALTTPYGRKLTLTAPTTNIKCHIICGV